MAMELKLTGLKGFVGEEEISQMTPLVQAAQDVLNGNITVGCLYFRQNNGIIQGTVIGNHVFY